MTRGVLFMLGLALVVLVAGCGGSTTYDKTKTRACLTARGAKTTNKLGADFVASTAGGGAFVADLGDNSVKLVFGTDESDAEQIQQAYQRFAFKNVQSGLSDVLRRYKNVVTLWHQHPQDSDLALIVGCLK